MAFSVKYSKRFQRMGVTATYRIDILSETGVGGIVPDKMGADPFQLKTLGAEKDDNKIVIGSEIAFEFVLLKRAGEANYDPLFKSEYRKHIVKFYNHDTGKKLWQGYLQPENMSKSVFESNLHIYLSATDGLKDLQDFDFLSNDNIVTERMTGLAILKLCLTNLDQDSQFQYNFIVKLGTKHALQDVNDTALEEITHDTRRFSKIENGKTIVDSCLTVIEKVLKPYSCILKQWGGEYYIINTHELATNYYTYSWALAFISKAVSGDAVNIDTYKFSRGAEESFIPPVKELGMRLLNRNIGGSEVPGINVYNGGTWDYTNYTSTYDDTQADYMQLDAINNAVPHTSNGFITLAADVSLQRITEGDYIKFRFIYKRVSLAESEDTNEWPEMVISIIKDGVEYKDIPYSYVGTVDFSRLYESKISSAFKMIGALGSTSDYNFKIEVFSNDPVNDYEIHLAEFHVTKVVIAEGEAITDVVFDESYRATSPKGKIKLTDNDFYFGDSASVTDFASLVIGGAVTDEWNREDEADARPLLYLWAKNMLISRQDYSEYLIIDIKDSGDNITPVNYIIFGGKYYHIASYDKSFRPSWLRAHLRQLITDDLAVSWEVTPLTSVDGQSSGSSSPYVAPVGGDYPGAGIALSNGAGWSTSVVNNSSNWNTAYAWGNHATAGYAPTDSPVFTTKITAPLIYGSSTANGDIVIEGTSHATKTTSKVLLQPTGGNVGIGVAAGSVDANRDLTVGIRGIKNLGSLEFAVGKNIYMGSVTDAGNRLNLKQVDASHAYIDYYEDLQFRSGVASSVNKVRFTTEGYVGILTDTPAGALCVNGGVHVGGDSDAGDNNLWIDGTAQEPSFSSGWSGSNWQITAAGNAEFENIIVRGSARFRELIIDQLSVIAGSQLLSIARGKVVSIDTVNSKVTLEDPNARGTSSFAANDFFWIKNVDIDKNLFTDCRGQVSAITGVTLTLDFTVAGANGAITDIAAGDVIIQRGHPTTAARQNLIYKTVSDANSPYERYLTGVDSLAAFTDLDNVVAQIGDLTTLASHDVVPASPGIGFYSANAYLSGRVVLPNAGMTNEGSAGTSIRIYAGDSYANRATADFMVTQDGALTATGACVLGSSSGAVDLGTSGSRGKVTSYSHLSLHGLFSKLGYSVQDTLNLSTLVYPFYYLDAADVSKTLTLPSSSEIATQGLADNAIVVFFNPTKGTFTVDGDDLDIIVGGALVGSFNLAENQTKTLMYFNNGGYQYWVELN